MNRSTRPAGTRAVAAFALTVILAVSAAAAALEPETTALQIDSFSLLPDHIDQWLAADWVQ